MIIRRSASQLLRLLLGNKNGEFIYLRLINKIRLTYFYRAYFLYTRLKITSASIFTYNGLSLEVPENDLNVIDEIYRWKVYDRCFCPKSGDIVIDVGAHIGAYTVKASKLVGESGLVVAAEPFPLNHAYLMRNIRKNNLSNVKPLKIALGEDEGTAKLSLGRSGLAHSIVLKRSNEATLVSVKRLDSIVEELRLSRVNFIKMDVEGAEYIVLKGAINTLRSNDVKLAIAAYHDDEIREKVKILLKKLKYTVSEIDGYVYAWK